MKGAPMFVYADQKVGESMETYRARTKTCPFRIPMMRYSDRMGLTAEIHVMTPERVSGVMCYFEPYTEHNRAFDVKHDGKKFSIGSGSSKHTFYFKNWNKL